MLRQASREARFVLHLVKLNLASNMEYRVSFLSQVFGMMINNGIYFVFWLLFFDRFEEIRGYQMDEIFMLFAVITFSYGLAYTFAGNATRVAELIAQGRLDYYLALPRPVLPHLVFSRMGQSTIGDLTFGVIAYLFTGRFDLPSLALFVVSSLLVAVIFIAFAVTIGSFAFFLGNASLLSRQLMNVLLTFSLYPFGLFQGVVRLILLTLVPAAFVGAVPVQVVQAFDLGALALLAGVTCLMVCVMLGMFRLGLRRYESGNAMNVNL
ncbi:MAG: ABC-2 family transporter protein [Anaerolineae bacterium]|nr:ABC-2 family transporter protein [Anaerolineae bacterium]